MLNSNKEITYIYKELVNMVMAIGVDSFIWEKKVFSTISQLGSACHGWLQIKNIKILINQEIVHLQYN